MNIIKILINFKKSNAVLPTWHQITKPIPNKKVLLKTYYNTKKIIKSKNNLSINHNKYSKINKIKIKYIFLTQDNNYFKKTPKIPIKIYKILNY